MDEVNGSGLQLPPDVLASLEQFLPPKAQSQLSVAIEAAKARSEVLRPLLLCGPTDPGIAGIATLVVGNMLQTADTEGVNVLFTDRHPDPEEVVEALVTNLADQGYRTVLGFMNIHLASQRVERWLTHVLPNFELSAVIGGRAALRGIEVPHRRIAVMATTDRPESLSTGLRSCFHHLCKLGSFGEDVLAVAIGSRANSLGLGVEDAACRLIARIAAGGSREAIRLFDLVRDFAEVRAEPMITVEVALEALSVMGVDIGHQDLTPISDEEPVRAGFTQTADRDSSDMDSLWTRLFESLGYSNIRVLRLEGDAEDCIVMESPDPLRGTSRVCVRLEYSTSELVGLQPVQALHSAIVTKREFDEGIIVTSGRFTDSAVEYAEQVRVIQLVDGRKLLELVAKAEMQ